ncbi:three component ABC system middle component [Flavicella sediminum]|uniref:three component ABC system middle component n=1 Tax=Flavicella sediminum TaxID=2585141 RepID=UPI00111EAD10|nr:three component ABC system middle component [Flavicella sediminum]
MNSETKELSLYDIMQNTALSALACHSFTLGYHKVARNKVNTQNYPPLKYFFFILPIVYHKDTRSTFKSSRELHNAILKNQEIILGLQSRANKMTPQTFDALNIAFSKNILTYNNKNIELMRGFSSKLIKIESSLGRENITKSIQDSAYKLGNIFAKNAEKNIQLELNIRF